jgi:hypothetical protein
MKFKIVSRLEKKGKKDYRKAKRICRRLSRKIIASYRRKMRKLAVNKKDPKYIAAVKKYKKVLFIKTQRFLLRFFSTARKYKRGNKAFKYQYYYMKWRYYVLMLKILRVRNIKYRIRRTKRQLHMFIPKLLKVMKNGIVKLSKKYEKTQSMSKKTKLILLQLRYLMLRLAYLKRMAKTAPVQYKGKFKAYSRKAKDLLTRNYIKIMHRYHTLLLIHHKAPAAKKT